MGSGVESVVLFSMLLSTSTFPPKVVEAVVASEGAMALIEAKVPVFEGEASGVEASVAVTTLPLVEESVDAVERITDKSTEVVDSAAESATSEEVLVEVDASGAFVVVRKYVSSAAVSVWEEDVPETGLRVGCTLWGCSSMASVVDSTISGVSEVLINSGRV